MKKVNMIMVMTALIYGLVLATTCIADDISNTIFTDKTFYSREYLTLDNGLRITLHSPDQIDLSLLLEDILADDEADDVNTKINEKRTALFPDNEIIMALAGAGFKLKNDRVDVANASGISLLKSIYWWNNSNKSGYYWYANYSCHAANMFTYVLSGSYLIYTNTSSTTTWDYKLKLNTGGVAGYSLYGTTGSKGFKGAGNSSSNKAHIVMYFYNAN